MSTLPNRVLLSLVPLLGLSGSALGAGIPAVSGAVQVLQRAEVQIGTLPVVSLAVPDRDAVIHLECTVGEDKQTVTSPVLPAGQALEVELNAVAPVSSAACVLIANFANGLTERRPLDVAWTWVEGVVPDQDELAEQELAALEGQPSSDGAAPSPEEGAVDDADGGPLDAVRPAVPEPDAPTP